MSGGRRSWDAVLFDLDGTLADTVELIRHSFRHTMVTHRGASSPEVEAHYLSTLGRPLRDQFVLFAEDADEAARMVDTYVAYQRTVHDEMVRPYPGSLEVVEELRERGVRLAVVTSKRREIADRTLARCGLAEAMDLLVSADDVERGKPDPEPVLLALERLELTETPGTVLFVGDSPYDLRAGREAGTRTAAAAWGPFDRKVLEPEEPDFWLESPGETLETGP